MSGLSVGAASGSVLVAAIHIGTASGARQATEGWVGTPAGNKQFFAIDEDGGGGGDGGPSDLSAGVSPGVTSWSSTGFFGYQSGLLSCTPAGGTPPYRYAWADLAEYAQPVSSTVQSTRFTVTDLSYPMPANVYCQVTDALGATVDSSIAVIS